MKGTLDYRQFVQTRILDVVEAQLRALPPDEERDEYLAELRDDAEGLKEYLVATLLEEVGSEGPVPEIGPAEAALLAEIVAELERDGFSLDDMLAQIPSAEKAAA